MVVYQQMTFGSSSLDLEVWETRHNVVLEIFPSGDSALRIHQQLAQILPSGDFFLGQGLESTNACGIEIK